MQYGERCLCHSHSMASVPGIALWNLVDRARHLSREQRNALRHTTTIRPFCLSTNTRIPLCIRGSQSAFCFDDSGVKVNYTPQLWGELSSKKYQILHNGALNSIFTLSLKTSLEHSKNNSVTLSTSTRFDSHLHSKRVHKLHLMLSGPVYCVRPGN